jgi:hypothetical protein
MLRKWQRSKFNKEKNVALNGCLFLQGSSSQLVLGPKPEEHSLRETTEDCIAVTDSREAQALAVRTLH